MGKAGRIACITIPWALTVASFICLCLIEISGWNKGILPSYYFMKADFTNLTTSGVNDLETPDLTSALKEAAQNNYLDNVYEVHLWNYCTSNSKSGSMDTCTGRSSSFVFNPVTVWGLNNTSVATTSTPSDNSNRLAAAENKLKSNTEALEDKLLGDAGRKALEAYQKLAKAMFYLYAISFWTSLATIVLSVVAIFSRWGSFFTWLFAFASSVVNVAAVTISTALFVALAGALKTILDPYNVSIDIGTHVLAVAWLSVVFSWAATLFWLFSVCCCSGRSNPHHRNNKGGLWNAEEKGQGYGNYGGRGMKVEKTGGGYERVASPYLGHAQDEHGDRVPLNSYPQQQNAGYEPYRHT